MSLKRQFASAESSTQEPTESIMTRGTGKHSLSSSLNAEVANQNLNRMFASPKKTKLDLYLEKILQQMKANGYKQSFEEQLAAREAMGQIPEGSHEEVINGFLSAFGKAAGQVISDELGVEEIINDFVERYIKPYAIYAAIPLVAAIATFAIKGDFTALQGLEMVPDQSFDFGKKEFSRNGRDISQSSNLTLNFKDKVNSGPLAATRAPLVSNQPAASVNMSYNLNRRSTGESGPRSSQFLGYLNQRMTLGNKNDNVNPLTHLLYLSKNPSMLDTGALMSGDFKTGLNADGVNEHYDQFSDKNGYSATAGVQYSHRRPVSSYNFGLDAGMYNVGTENSLNVLRYSFGTSHKVDLPGPNSSLRLGAAYEGTTVVDGDSSHQLSGRIEYRSGSYYFIARPKWNTDGGTSLSFKLGGDIPLEHGKDPDRFSAYFKMDVNSTETGTVVVPGIGLKLILGK